jgi:hypothetical protein
LRQFPIPLHKFDAQEITQCIMYPQIDWKTLMANFVVENLGYTIHSQQLKLSITIILLTFDIY